MYRNDLAFVRASLSVFVFVVDGDRTGAKASNVIKACEGA